MVCSYKGGYNMAKDNNKRKWEKDYEKYSTMNLDDEIKKL